MPSALKLIPAIHRTTHRIGLYIEQLDELGVTQAEAHILSHLVSNGDNTVAELHRVFGHKRSRVDPMHDIVQTAREMGISMGD